VDDALVLPAPRRDGGVAFGADLGFVSDSSALAGVTVAEPHAMMVLEERRPKKGEPLKPSVVLGDFGETIKRYGGDKFCADAHYRETAKEYLEPRGIEFVDTPGGQGGKGELYLNAKKLIHERRVRLANVPRLLAQLRQIMSRPLPGGGVQITTPRRRGGGGHGDLVSALVAALWSAREEAEPDWVSLMKQARANGLFGHTRAVVPQVRSSRPTDNRDIDLPWNQETER
jgi:hypothetical protein